MNSPCRVAPHFIHRHRLRPPLRVAPPPGPVLRPALSSFVACDQGMDPQPPALYSPNLGEVARASLARVTELCGAAFWRKNRFYYILAAGASPIHLSSESWPFRHDRPPLRPTPRGARGDVPTSRLALPVRSSTRGLHGLPRFGCDHRRARLMHDQAQSHLGSLIALTTSRHDTTMPFTSRPAATASTTQSLADGHVTHSSVATRSSLRPPLLPYARGFKPPCLTP